MQAKVEQLEAEKQALEHNLTKTRTLIEAMQGELRRVKTEYGFASGALAQVRGKI